MSGRSRDLKVEALPTKEFFIHMLTRDIPLIPAINDLIDNAVDGARRLRKEEGFKGLQVSLELSSQEFRIEDNCGGIPLDVAQHYAFRFGRPEGAKSTPYSTGQFGVGMKRALFKLGREFSVESRTASEHFIVDVDVEKWAEREDWSFTFTTKADGLRNPPEERGTRIRVGALYPEVKEEFARETFRNELRLSIAKFQFGNLAKSLAMTVQGNPVEIRPIELLASKSLVPGVLEFDLGNGVSARVLVGVGERNAEEAGWYIFCNDRMVVSADQSDLTGWGDDLEMAIPKFHPSVHNAFRGYVFLEAKDTSKLPWNTTKVGVDRESIVYKSLRLRMISAMKPVTDFLRKAYAEYTDETEPLRDAIASARPTPAADLRKPVKFAAPAAKPKSAPDTASIQYKVPMKRLKKAKAALGVESNRAVGEKTFAYFYDRECE